MSLISKEKLTAGVVASYAADPAQCCTGRVSSLFAVMPAAGIGSTENAYHRYMAIEQGPQPTAPLPVVGVVCALLGRSDTGLSPQRVPDGRGVVLRAEDPHRMDCLRTVLTLTAERDLAVFEVESRRLYNPRERVRIPVTVGAQTLPYLTEAILDELLADPAHTDDPTLTVTRTPTRYIRHRALPEDVHELEHRQGDDYFRLFTDDHSLVRRTIWSWAVDDSWWQDAIAWQRTDGATEYPTDSIDSVWAELRQLEAETQDMPALELFDTLADMDDLTQSILDRADTEGPDTSVTEDPAAADPGTANRDTDTENPGTT